MTATGTEAISLAQLKDYADNQSATGESEYTYRHTMLTNMPSTHGRFKTQSISASGYGNPYAALCFNENELILECAVSAQSQKIGIAITSDTGQIHCLTAGNSNSESYPVYQCVPYTVYGNVSNTGNTVLLVSKSENTITIESTLNLPGANIVLFPRLRFYLTDE